MTDPFRELDEALLKVIDVVKERVVRGEISREEMVHFLDIVEERIRSMLEAGSTRQYVDSLSVHERRKLIKGLGSRVDQALSALNEYLETYFSEEMDREGKPH